MERSNKRSPRLDEEMDRETASLIQSGQTESRSDEALIKEGPLPDEQAPARPAIAHEPVGPGQPTDDEIERRSRLAQALVPHLFPADRPALSDWARAHEAPDWVVALIERLPDDEMFANVEAVWEAAGGPHEHR
jgi:hypothetical protein